MGVDLLISEGHSFSDIKDYSWPQFNFFLYLVSNRYERQEVAAKEATSKDGARNRGNVTVKDRYENPKRR